MIGKAGMPLSRNLEMWRVLAEVQEKEFRQARQLKPNLYFKVDDSKRS